MTAKPLTDGDEPDDSLNFLDVELRFLEKALLDAIANARPPHDEPNVATLVRLECLTRAMQETFSRLHKGKSAISAQELPILLMALSRIRSLIWAVADPTATVEPAERDAAVLDQLRLL